MERNFAIKHIALFKFVEGTSDATIEELLSHLRALKTEISGIVDFSAGPYESREALNQGFTHAFIMTFKDAESRDNYLPHPAHDRVRALVLPHVASVVVFDYRVNE